MLYSIKGHWNSILNYGHPNNQSISYSSDSILLATCEHSEPYGLKYPSTLHTNGGRYQVKRLGISLLSSQLVSCFCIWNLVPKVAQSSQRDSQRPVSPFDSNSVSPALFSFFISHIIDSTTFYESPRNDIGKVRRWQREIRDTDRSLL